MREETVRCVDCGRQLTVAWFLASEAIACGCRLEAALALIEEREPPAEAGDPSTCRWVVRGLAALILAHLV